MYFIEKILKDTIAAGRRHTIGLKSDGTVVAVGGNEYGQCDISGWRASNCPTINKTGGGNFYAIRP